MPLVSWLKRTSLIASIRSSSSFVSRYAAGTGALVSGWMPSTPLASTVTTCTAPDCAVLLASISPIRTEVPSAPSVTWLSAVLAEPAPFIEVETLNESSVDFLVRPFCEGAHWFDVRYGAPEAVYNQLNKDKIEIPFPQRVVHLSK